MVARRTLARRRSWFMKRARPLLRLEKDKRWSDAVKGANVLWRRLTQAAEAVAGRPVAGRPVAEPHSGSAEPPRAARRAPRRRMWGELGRCQGRHYERAVGLQVKEERAPGGVGQHAA